MKTKHNIVLFAALLGGAAVFANECVIRFGRNDEVINVKATNISMREEEIVITLHKDYYDVGVTFDFVNSGSEQKVQLGFPVEGTFYDFDDNVVYDFESEVNGKVIPVNTMRKDTISYAINKLNMDQYIKWFIRDVTFPAKSHTGSRVTYKARYSDCGNLTSAGYIYGTGRFWKGGIGKMTVIINHGDDVLIDQIKFGGHAQDQAKMSKFILEANGRYKYIFENINPTSTRESIFISVKIFKSGLYGEYTEQFGEIERDYSWIWNEQLLYNSPTDVRFYTKNQIRLFINFFSAIHGYDFKNPLYKEYFSKIESFGDKDNTKYQVNPNFRESDFNETERKNIDYLLKLEKMIPKDSTTKGGGGNEN